MLLLVHYVAMVSVVKHRSDAYVTVHASFLRATNVCYCLVFSDLYISELKLPIAGGGLFAIYTECLFCLLLVLFCCCCF